MRRILVLGLPCLLAGVLLCGEGPRLTVTPELLAPLETAEARMLLRDDLLEAETWRLRGLKVAPVYQRLYDSTVSVSVREEANTLLIELRPTPRGSARPSVRGTFTLVRSLQDGTARSFRILIREEPGCFLEVRPAGDRSVLDLYLLDGAEPLYREVTVPVPFGELLQSSLERITSLTAAKVDWGLALYAGSRADDRLVEGLAASIRSRVPTLRDADDGALSEDGRYVSIASLSEQPPPGGLNCSGFVKWVVDGFYYPLTGRNTSVAEAKRPPAEDRGNSLTTAMASSDPYFGLDWNRNLAAMLDAARGGSGARAGTAAFDVTAGDAVPYTRDVGYPVPQLTILLYRLAVSSPGMFYLGSINDVVGAEGGLLQYFHTLVALPYFDAAGVFRVAVFERTRESDLGSLASRYPGAHVHLVAVPAEGTFSPLQAP